MPKFENFSKSDKAIDRKERGELIEKYLRILSENIKEEAELLKEDGFGVDDECRIDPDKLVGQHPKYTEEFITKIKNNFLPLKERFEKARQANQNIKERQDFGELLEIVKTLLFNQDFFNGRIKVVRTSKIDDINNGIDEIALDSKTNFVIGVIDVTTDIENKKNFDIKMKLGGKLDFGVIPKKDRENTVIAHEPLSELPLYVFEMNKNSILNIARAKATGEYQEDDLEAIKFLEKHTLDQFIYCGNKILNQKDLSDKMRAQYTEANQIFIEISKEKGYIK